MNLYEYSEIYIYINLSVQTHIRVTGISIHDTFHNVLRMHFIIGNFKLFTIHLRTSQGLLSRGSFGVWTDGPCGRAKSLGSSPREPRRGWGY